MALPLDPARSWSTPVHSPDGSRVAVVADLCELFEVRGGSAESIIRNDDGYWQQVEEYFEKRDRIRFTHGICADCANDQMKDHPHAMPPVTPS